MGKLRVALVVGVILLLNIGLITVPSVAQPTTPHVSTIARDGPSPGGYAHPPDGGDTVTLTDPNGIPVSDPYWGYDPTRGTLGPLVMDIPTPGAPPGGMTAEHLYTIIITWTGAYNPVFVGGLGNTQDGQPFWEVSGNTLTIRMKSIMRVVGGAYPRWVCSFIAFFSSPTVTSTLTENDGGMVCFHAESFSISEGERPGILIITVTGYEGQTSGFLKLFMPATVPAQFGKTLDDVIITVDGARVTATSTDTSSLVLKNGVGVTGRLWEFTVTFSTRTIKSNPNPGRATVGGVHVPVNPLTFLAPYLTVMGLVVAASSTYVLRRRNRQKVR